MTVQARLCRTWSETQVVGFHMRRLILLLSPLVTGTLGRVCYLLIPSVQKIYKIISKPYNLCIWFCKMFDQICTGLANATLETLIKHGDTNLRLNF